jgi:rhodanese-related sulfurtransferase/thiol-disulfide isomerase/thioredoxin
VTTRSPSRPRAVNNRRAREVARAQARRRWTVAAVVVAAASVLAAVAALAFTGGGGSAKGFSAAKTAFDLPALSGDGHVRLADHAGRPVVVNFFASWCVYCNEELPGFVQVAKASSDRVDFIGVDTNDTGDGAAMAGRFDLAGAGFALARDVGAAPSSDLWRQFGGQGLPVTAFYDATGKLVDFSGGMLEQSALEQRLRANFGVEVRAVDAAALPAPVIPLIPRGAFELVRNHAGDPAWVTLDVRTPAEFSAGHVPDATNLDFYDPQFRARLARLDRDRSYVVYCHTGNRSSQATALMHSLGFKHVYDVQGGINAWQQAGLPVTP